jgi:hypothetical protein
VDDFRQLIDLDQLTGDETVTLARTPAEAIHGLNWTTNSAAGLNQPSTAYDIISALSLAASRLPQLITQITRYLGQPPAPAGSAMTAVRTPPPRRRPRGPPFARKLPRAQRRPTEQQTRAA